MSKVITLLKAEWDGQSLSETVKCDGRRFKIVTGLRNGGGENRVYILGNDGWAYFLNKADVSIEETVCNNASYVSNASERLYWAENLNKVFKKAIAKVF